MPYEGNLKFSHKNGEVNHGSPWNLVDVWDIIRTRNYKCDYMKEMWAPNWVFLPIFFILYVYMLPRGQILWFFDAICVLLIFFYSKPPKMQLNAKDNPVLFENCD